MASSGCNVSDAYIRCYKALHLVTRKAIPCVDNCLTLWHSNQKLHIKDKHPQEGKTCPQFKKPRQSASCQSCVEWGDAVEGMLYQPGKIQITWPNVVSSQLSKSHVEVAKAFVLKLPKTSRAAQTDSKLEEFDSASLLMIMTRFKDFHREDQTSFQTIQKVIVFT